MTNQYGKLFAIFLFALLQCFAPLVHAHPAAEQHSFSGSHGHSVVELYCLDSEKSQCPEARVEVLDWQAVGTALASSKKLPPRPALASLSSVIWPGQSLAHSNIASAPLPNISIPPFPHVSPPAHAPPVIL